MISGYIYKGEQMETNLVFEGFKFMALGMGTVLTFLILMIFAMNLMSKVIHRFFPEPTSAPVDSSTPASNQGAKVAAISAAIQFHRNKKA